MLDIYGWPTRLVDDTDGAVRVTWVEPMPVEGLRWTTLRTKFR
jgi:hypothetical protein